MPRVHVTFGDSACGSLRVAFGELGHAERVLALADDLALGPLDPIEPAVRARWWEEEVGVACDTDTIAAVREARHVLAELAPSDEVVAWVSRRSVTEYCGLCELADHVTHLSVVDVADHAFTRPDGTPDLHASLAFAGVGPRQIVDHALLDCVLRVGAEQRQRYAGEWQRVRAENASLRILTDDGLASQSLAYFDPQLVANITADWQSCRRVVGKTAQQLASGHHRQVSSDLFLFDRLMRLVDVGELVESRVEPDSGDRVVRLSSRGLGARN